MKDEEKSRKQLLDELELLRKRNAELEVSSQELTDIIESMGDGFFILNDDLEVKLFNRAAEGILGRDKNDVLDRQLFEAFPEAKDSDFEKNYTRAVNEKTTINFETYFAIEPYEGWYDVHVSPHANGISVHFHLANERKRMEEALRESEERYRVLAEMSHDTIFVINRDDVVEYVNEFAASQFSCTPEDLIGGIRQELFPQETADSQKNALQQVFETGQPVRVEEISQFAHREIWLDNYLVPIKNESGEVRAVMGVSRDITDRKQAEERLYELNSVLLDLGPDYLKNVNNLTAFAGRKFVVKWWEMLRHSTLPDAL